MVVAIVLVTFVVFILVDLVLRLLLRRFDEAKRRRERQEALNLGLRVDVSREAKSLKRVEVDEPRARILAVDDEPVILDSFRKILVLAGYSVDTVESGPEALGLVQKSEYDFVFTDLKMPELDGLEVTKAVKHLRPDVDVIMITGYATVESAVDAMKYGAMDYVQKPFTEDELVGFVNKSLIRREARIERQQPQKVHLVTASDPVQASERVFNVPAGVFVSPSHVWIRIEMTGEVRAGMDDFARKTIGGIDEIVPPKPGREIHAGQPLFSIRQGARTMVFASPVTGRITRVNDELSLHPEHLTVNPYELGWICRLEPRNLSGDLESLKIGAGAIAWYQEESNRLAEMFEKAQKPTEADEDTETLSDESWEIFAKTFLHLEPRDRVA